MAVSTAFAMMLAAALWLATAPAAAQTPAAMNETVQMVKIGSGLSGAELETTLFKPDGDGPFPLAVINHGQAPGNPVFQERARFLVATREFVRRGYAVALPMRMGFSKSSGAYASGGCNIAANGELQAQWVDGVLEWLRAQPYVDAERIVLIGQSHGGLTTMALGARNPAGVRGLINFAGGLKYTDSGCIWENSLAQAFARYGARSKLPKSHFANLEDIATVPYLRDAGRQGYANFLHKGLPRAFAIGPTGAWGWAAEGDDPSARALANYQRNSKAPCRLYAVDEDVVWNP